MGVPLRVVAALPIFGSTTSAQTCSRFPELVEG